MNTPAIDQFKSAVLTAAAQAIVSEMTPEKLREVAREMIASALDEVVRYGSLQSQVRKAAEQCTAVFLAEPEIKAALAKAVKEGLEAALETLPGEVRDKVTDLALKSLENGIASAKNARNW